MTNNEQVQLLQFFSDRFFGAAPPEEQIKHCIQDFHRDLASHRIRDIVPVDSVLLQRPVPTTNRRGIIVHEA